jgi:pimeloyl-ACP methyl ester carboxylesterase
VRAPALLLTGEDDRKFTDIAAEMSKLLPESRALTIPSAGHTVHLEQPDAWLEAVTSWLA